MTVVEYMPLLVLHAILIMWAKLAAACNNLILNT